MNLEMLTYIMELMDREDQEAEAAFEKADDALETWKHNHPDFTFGDACPEYYALDDARNNAWDRWRKVANMLSIFCDKEWR